MSKKSFLKDLRVEKICTEDWGEMSGNEQVRFCSHCSLNVNNISEMSRAEALRLVKKSKGRLCVRYVQHPKTKAPVFANKLYQITRRTGVAAGMLGATLAASSMTYAQGNVFEPKTITELPTALKKANQTDAEKPKEKTTGTGMISGVITDPVGAVIPGSIVSLKSENTKQTIRSDENGFYKFKNLPFEKFEITVNSPGFSEFKNSQVFLTKANSPRKFDASIDIDGSSITGMIVVATTFESPLVKAVYDEEPRKVQSLISRGADVSAKDREFYSRTALHVAVDDGNLQIVRSLLNAGADVNALDEDGNTPLMMLDEETPTEIIKLLVRYGIKLDIQSKETKSSALINAAMNNNYKAMKILIEAGANVNLRDSDDDSALDLVDNEETEQLLIAYGAERDE